MYCSSILSLIHSCLDLLHIKGGQTSGSAWLLGGVDLTIYEVYELKQVLSRATAAKSLCTKNFMNKAKLLLELQALKFYTLA